MSAWAHPDTQDGGISAPKQWDLGRLEFLKPKHQVQKNLSCVIEIRADPCNAILGHCSDEFFGERLRVCIITAPGVVLKEPKGGASLCSREWKRLV